MVNDFALWIAGGLFAENGAPPALTPAATCAYNRASRLAMHRAPLFSIAAVMIPFAAVLAQTQAQPLTLGRHWTGQSVDPAYEGYDINADGTFNLWFGYLNRNYEETPDIPVGPNNNFSPGPADRGQPAYFAVRRHKDVFAVVVPKDFGIQKLVWTIVSHGQTQKVTGTLDRVWQIDRKYTTREADIRSPYSNLPPEVKLRAAADGNTSAPLEIEFEATDDMRPAVAGKPIGMTFAWVKYRGPGNVKFEPAKGKVENGKASVQAFFDVPGEYVLQVVVDDGSGVNAGNFAYQCCWTNAQIRVTVGGK